MSAIELRPSFERYSSLPSNEIIDKLRTAFEEESTIEGRIAHDRIYLSIPKEKQHLWSPRLTLEIEEHDDKTEIHALFGPNPNVWMMFIFFYSLLAFLAFVVLIIGGSRWNLGLSVGVLWFFPVLCIIFIFAFLSARAGQKLAKEQMWELYHFMHHSLPNQIFRKEDFNIN